MGTVGDLEVRRRAPDTVHTGVARRTGWRRDVRSSMITRSEIFGTEELLLERNPAAAEVYNAIAGWARTSIVDLMKLLDLDSSIGERKALAKELGYTGDTADSASMNIWLHRQVMNKLAANGGKVPADLKD